MAARIIKIMGLAVLAAALTASFASAKPYVADQTQSVSTPAVSSPQSPNDRAGSQGIGQNSTDFGMGGQYGQNLITDAQAAKATVQSTPTVIPYLSHGVGVDQSQFSGSPVRPDDRAGARPSVPTSVPTSFAAPVSTTGDGGFSWGSAGIGAAGIAAIAVAIGLLMVLGRRSRHEGVAAS